MSVELVSEKPLLTHADRCDRCGGRAYVVTVLRWTPRIRQGGELLWCRHHYAKYAHVLEPLTAQLIDERYTLTEHIADDGHFE